MLNLELVPDLTHCIETIARKEHTAVLKQLLTYGHEDKELEEKSEILRLFLETADFRQLRAESEKRLMEGREVKFVVYLDNGALKYDIQVT